ncbi:MAG: hypothetical protein J2P28_11560 [Actinobacteria bacterium]|nr:hypothetical protein [Actinomycetota bacterium]
MSGQTGAAEIALLLGTLLVLPYLVGLVLVLCRHRSIARRFGSADPHNSRWSRRPGNLDPDAWLWPPAALSGPASRRAAPRSGDFIARQLPSPARRGAQPS